MTLSWPSPAASTTRRPRRAGVALLDVMIALAILGSAGLAAVAITREAIQAVARARLAGGELARANAFLEAVALWPREDLDLRLGDRSQGPWRLRIERTAPALYVVILTDTLAGRPLLRTALYRPEQADAAR